MSRAFTSLVLLSALVFSPGLGGEHCHCDTAQPVSQCYLQASLDESQCQECCDLTEFIPKGAWETSSRTPAPGWRLTVLLARGGKDSILLGLTNTILNDHSNIPLEFHPLLI